jgi:hypothetical protein
MEKPRDYRLASADQAGAQPNYLPKLDFDPYKPYENKAGASATAITAATAAKKPLAARSKKVVAALLGGLNKK